MSPAYPYVIRYTRPPSPTTVGQAVSLHQNVRSLFGEAEYITFLQGSYKNDTALWDMNDVDIVAVTRSIYSTQFAGTIPENPASGIPWDEIFARLERKLWENPWYRGKWRREDKCIRLNTGVKIDIVPAVFIAGPEIDPIAIFSFASGAERKNWPRDHYQAGVDKSRRTSGAYKQTVRMLKRWARCWFGTRKVAPSYYLECAVFAQPDSWFTGDVERDFVSIARQLVSLPYSAWLPRIAGEGNLLDQSEWDMSRFFEFQLALRQALVFAEAALVCLTENQARHHWTAAFNGQVST